MGNTRLHPAVDHWISTELRDCLDQVLQRSRSVRSLPRELCSLQWSFSHRLHELFGRFSVASAALHLAVSRRILQRFNAAVASRSSKTLGCAARSVHQVQCVVWQMWTAWSVSFSGHLYRMFPRIRFEECQSLRCYFCTVSSIWMLILFLNLCAYLASNLLFWWISVTNWSSPRLDTFKKEKGAVLVLEFIRQRMLWGILKLYHIGS